LDLLPQTPIVSRLPNPIKFRSIILNSVDYLPCKGFYLDFTLADREQIFGYYIIRGEQDVQLLTDDDQLTPHLSQLYDVFTQKHWIRRIFADIDHLYQTRTLFSSRLLQENLRTELYSEYVHPLNGRIQEVSFHIKPFPYVFHMCFSNGQFDDLTIEFQRRNSYCISLLGFYENEEEWIDRIKRKGKYKYRLL
jgi:hypothetical protein